MVDVKLHCLTDVPLLSMSGQKSLVSATLRKSQATSHHLSQNV